MDVVEQRLSASRVEVAPPSSEDLRGVTRYIVSDISADDGQTPAVCADVSSVLTRQS
jgi:hypothetical protein